MVSNDKYLDWLNQEKERILSHKVESELFDAVFILHNIYATNYLMLRDNGIKISAEDEESLNKALDVVIDCGDCVRLIKEIKRILGYKDGLI